MASDADIYIVKKSDSEYPALLKEIHDAPEILYVRGILPQPDEWLIGVVGTRKPTEYGKHVAHAFSESLAASGAIVVSGLAYGIDAEAHKGVVAARGKGLAVIGSGLDKESFYPQANWQLAEEIIRLGGAVISEYAPGTPAMPFRFPERNRIIVGLIKGLVVVEGKDKSGAQITARLALEENRDVFAVPGPIYSPTSFLPNRLIKEGATPLLSPEEIFEYYGKSYVPVKNEEALEGIEAVIIEALQEPLSLDELKASTKAEVTALQAALSLLELGGKIAEIEPGRYQCVR